MTIPLAIGANNFGGSLTVSFQDSFRHFFQQWVGGVLLVVLDRLL